MNEQARSEDALREAYTQVANDLAAWIDAAPLPPSDLHPVYAGHVLLCELIRGLARVQEVERKIEAAFEAGWSAYIRQQTPSGDSQDAQEAFAEWRRIGRPL